MKTRNGFVSNSSSSSFVVVAGAEEEVPTISVKAKITDLCEHVIRNVKQLEEYLVDKYGNWRKPDQTFQELLKDDYVAYEVDDIKEIYEDYKKKLNEGKILYIGQCSSEDENSVSNAMYCESGGIELSHGEWIE